MQANLVAYHDDSPCTVRLVDGFCPVCRFIPDMQSIALAYHCPDCDIELKKMKCPQCDKTFTKN